MWMSSLEAKIKGTKDKKPTAEKLERLRREKVGPQHSNIATDYLLSVGVSSEVGAHFWHFPLGGG